MLMIVLYFQKKKKKKFQIVIDNELEVGASWPASRISWRGKGFTMGRTYLVSDFLRIRNSKWGGDEK